MINLVIFHQGKAAEAGRDRLVNLIEKKRKGCFQVTFVDKMGGGSEGSIFTRLVKAIDQNTVAIGLLDKEERPASHAGNLWFEMGAWMINERQKFGHSPEDMGKNFLLLIHGSEDEKDKKFISNLQGKTPVFYGDKVANAWDPLEGFLDRCIADFGDAPRSGNGADPHLGETAPSFEPMSPDQASRAHLEPKHRKIKETIGLDRDDFSAEHLERCPSSQQPCAVHLSSLAVIAEMARQTKASHEHFVIASHLFKIASTCEILLQTGKIRGKANRTLTKKQAARLSGLCGALIQEVDTCLKRNSAFHKEQEREEPKDRLFHFLVHRLKLINTNNVKVQVGQATYSQLNPEFMKALTTHIVEFASIRFSQYWGSGVMDQDSLEQQLDHIDSVAKQMSRAASLLCGVELEIYEKLSADVTRGLQSYNWSEPNGDVISTLRDSIPASYGSSPNSLSLWSPEASSVAS